MLTKIVRLLYASFIGLFCCKRSPEVGDVPATGQTRQSPRLVVIVDDPSEVTWDTQASPVNDKSCSPGDQNNASAVSQATAQDNLPNQANQLVPPLGGVGQPNLPSKHTKDQHKVSGQRAKPTSDFRHARVYDPICFDASSIPLECEETRSFSARSEATLLSADALLPEKDDQIDVRCHEKPEFCPLSQDGNQETVGMVPDGTWSVQPSNRLGDISSCSGQ